MRGVAHHTSMPTFRSLLRRSISSTTSTLIEVHISARALRENYALYRSLGIPVAPVLKSNAYGHGLVEVAHVLEREQPPMFVVDSYYEARSLRHHGIRAPILVIGYVPADIISRNRLRDVSFTLTSLDGIRALGATSSRACVHVKLDTGMHRQGLVPSEIDEAIALLKQSSLVVEGVCSHFADIDGTTALSAKQIALWGALLPRWKQEFALRYWHIAASAGAPRTKEFDSNLVRLGAGLYGFETIPNHASPRPVLSVHSQLTVVKDLEVHESVGYNATFVSQKPMRIATVPVGYFEGFDRRLSNKGSMQIGGVACPVLGRVSMNMTTIDVSDVPDARLGTPVVVISDEPIDPNSILNLSALCDTAPLDFIVHIPAHLRRVVEYAHA